MPIPEVGYLKVVAKILPVNTNMWTNNQSLTDGFILLGFSDRPWLETPLFVIFLVAYMFALFGNISIILVSRLDPQLDSPVYFFCLQPFSSGSLLYYQHRPSDAGQP